MSKIVKLSLLTSLCLLSLALISTRLVLADPISGSVDIDGRVDGTPSSQPALIDSPTDGDIFSNSTVTISGSCPSSTIVELYRNNVLAGSVICDLSNDTFSVPITLVSGANNVYARVKDTLDQYGPDSTHMQLFYIPPVVNPQAFPSPNLDTTANSPSTIIPLAGSVDLLLSGDGARRGFFTNQELKVSYVIKGGQPPYTVKIFWGDGAEDSFESFKAGQYFATHTYTVPGTYNIVLTIIDSSGHNAFFQTVAIVNGSKADKQCASLNPPPKNFVATEEKPCPNVSTVQIYLDHIWPAFTIASLALMVLALLYKLFALLVFS